MTIKEIKVISIPNNLCLVKSTSNFVHMLHYIKLSIIDQIYRITKPEIPHELTIRIFKTKMKLHISC